MNCYTRFTTTRYIDTGVDGIKCDGGWRGMKKNKPRNGCVVSVAADQKTETLGKQKKRRCLISLFIVTRSRAYAASAAGLRRKITIKPRRLLDRFTMLTLFTRKKESNNKIKKITTLFFIPVFFFIPFDSKNPW